jgi:MFS family permease
MATLICLAMFGCNLMAAGPTIAIVSTAMDFFPGAGMAGLSGSISKTAYFFTTTALLQGLGNLMWMPLVNKYGRRPVYIGSYTLYLAVAIWLCFDKSYGGFLAGRILMGVASGAAESMAPLSIADGESISCAKRLHAHLGSLFLARAWSSNGVSSTFRKHKEQG